MKSILENIRFKQYNNIRFLFDKYIIAISFDMLFLNAFERNFFYFTSIFDEEFNKQ